MLQETDLNDSNRVKSRRGNRMALKYKNLSSSELILGQEVLGWLLNDDEIMDAVDGFHQKGSRCAVVVWVEDEDVVDAYISDGTALKEEFDLTRIHQAVETYDPEENVCVVVVRDHKNTVVLVGDIG
jgi:hypothetical protein